MKRFYKRSFHKVFVSLFILIYTFVPQALAMEEVINTLQEDYAAPTQVEVVEKPIVETPTEEKVVEQPIVDIPIVEEPTVEESIVDIPIIEEPAVDKPIIEPKEVIKEAMSYPVWVHNGNTAVTSDVVKLGKTYIAPQNSRVRIIFTKLPENPSKLTINEITLTQEEIGATGAVSNKAYDITTEMVNGTFEYDLTLPSIEEDTKVVYVEERSELLTGVKEVTNTVVKGEDTIKVQDLEHFTIFAVVAPNSTINSNSVGNQGNAWVSDNNYAIFDSSSDYAEYGFPNLGIPSGATIEGIEVLVEGKTTGRDLDISLWNQSNSSPAAYTNTKTADLTGSESIVTVGGSSDKWGKSWIDTDFNSDFKIMVNGAYYFWGGTASLDHIQVKVAYSIPLTPPTLTNNSSDPVALTSVGGIWTSINGGSGHTGINTSEIRWGSPSGSQKSGLRFTNSGLQSFDTGETFYLGMLTHMNWGTYAGTAASGATLQITLNFDRPNIPDVVLDYDFDIEETSNTAGACKAYQISNTPCDDKITFPNSYGTQVFTIGDIQYTLVIDGFVNAYPSGNAVSAFITEEEKENSAFLVGHLSSILVQKPEIRLTKKTNDQDITSAPGQNLYIGDTVEWKYIIQNSGNVTLTNVSIVDNQLANIDCDSVTPGLQNTGLTLASGETVICTASGTVTAGQYENTAIVKGNPPTGAEVSASDSSWYYGIIQKGHLIVQKTTIPANDQTVFLINTTSTTGGTITGGGLGTITDSVDKDYEVTPGTYSVIETVPTGWSITGDTCQNVVVAAGETKYCEITNTKNATLTLVKTVVNDNGGNAVANNFQAKIDEVNVPWGVPQTVTLTSHIASEITLPGYSASIWGGDCAPDGTVSLTAGETKTCTITNDDQQSYIIVDKTVKNDNGGLANADDFKLTVDSNAVLDEVAYPVNPGVHTVGETNLPGYMQGIWGTDCNAQGSVTVALGETKTCTITNDDNAPSLTLNKVLVNDNGGTALESAWTLTANGGNAGTLTGPGTSGSTDVVSGTTFKAGTYTLSESTGPSGYAASAWSCIKNGANPLEGNTITLGLGDVATCTITNDDIAPKLTVIKKVVNYTDGTKNAGDFTISVSGINVSNSSFSGSEAGTTVTLYPGQYSVTEVEDTINYIASYSDDCSGTIALGEDKTCTITNNDIDLLPIIKVTKTANTTSIPETGENVTFIFNVENQSKEAVTITSLADSVFGTLSGDADCHVGTTLLVGGSCNFIYSTFLSSDSLTPHTNTFTAEAKDNEDNSASDSDTETVTFTDVAPLITVTKTVDDNSIPETGQSVTFTYRISNTGTESVTVTSVIDDKFGDLLPTAKSQNGGSDIVILINSYYEFTYTTTLSSDTLTAHTNRVDVIAEDNEGTTATGYDTETVTFEDVKPDITVTKTANVTTVPETGGDVIFTFTVTNNSAEAGEITVLHDNKFGVLSGDDDCKVGTILTSEASCSFQKTFTIPEGIAPNTHENVFSVTVKDNEGNTDTETDNEIITLTPVPSIKLVKEVVNQYGSNLGANNWTLYANGESLSFSNRGDEGVFEYVTPGIPYTLSENDLQNGFESSGWSCTGGTLEDNIITLQAEDDVTCTITNSALPATIIVYKDVTVGESGRSIYSEDTFTVVLDKNIENYGVISDTEADPQIAIFGLLDSGLHSISEITKDGYRFGGCWSDEYPSEGGSMSLMQRQSVEGSEIYVENGETREITCYNEIIQPELEISKTNDSNPLGIYAGDTVTYTITVTAPIFEEDGGTYVLKDVKVTDIIPEGFKYVAGSWTGTTVEPIYQDNMPAIWSLGDMKEGDTITLTYRTKVSLLQDPGLYKDIAYTYGSSLLSGANGDILGRSMINHDTSFVGTEVLVVELAEIEEGEVLGASIGLPRTGAETYLTLGALISMILGFILLVFDPKKNIKNLVVVGILLLGIFTFIQPIPTYAAENIKVRIEVPQSPTKSNSFDIGFVALDILDRPISVQCYKAGGIPFGPSYVLNSGDCKVDSTIINSSGTYTFYVIATAGGDYKTSDTVTVVVDLEKPSAVTNYSKAKGVCLNILSFKTANDGRTSKIQIFRSDKQPFTANASTLIKEITVGPNTDVTYTDTPLPVCSTEYYYAIRSLDQFSNSSTFVTDDIVTVVKPSTTKTTTTPVAITGSEQGEVAGETVNDDGVGRSSEEVLDENGDVAGEETTTNGQGEDRDTDTEEDDDSEDSEEKSFWETYRYVIIILGVIALSSVGYIYAKRGRK